MTALRCTAKLRRRLGFGELAEPGPATAALGDWYAHLVTVERQPLVLAVSERSLLAVIFPARDLRNLSRHFLRGLADRLRRIGASEAAIERELAGFQPFVFAPTASRSVLGSINDFADQIRMRGRYEPGQWTPAQLEDALGEVPCSPLGYAHPADVARQRLGAEGELIRGPWPPGRRV